MSAEAALPVRRPSSAVARRAAVTPLEKAAMILAAIGPDLAAGILRQLSEADIERFVAALRGLGRVGPETLDAVIAEFLDRLARGADLVGGEAATRALLAAVIDDPGELERLLGGHPRGAARSVWERIEAAPAPPLATLLSAEHPQTAAVVLGALRPETGSLLLERFEPGFAQAVLLRLARQPRLETPAAEALEAAIGQGILAELDRARARRDPAELIAGLLGNVAAETRDGLLAFIDGSDGQLARRVQRAMFTFEDIATRLQPRDVAGALREVPEPALLRALRIARDDGNPAAAFVLANLPRRLAERYAEEIDALDPAGRSEGEKAQLEITRVIQAQVRAGSLRLVDPDPADVTVPR